MWQVQAVSEDEGVATMLHDADVCRESDCTSAAAM